MADPEVPKNETLFDVGAMRIARVYAEALLDVSEKNQQTSSILEEVDSLVDDVLRKDARLEALLFGEATGPKVRKDALTLAFSNTASPTVLNFLNVLNDHDRLELLPAIRQALHDLVNDRQKRKKVVVHSAAALPDDVKETLRSTIRSAYQFEPVLETYVDPDLLGGLKIRIGDRQVDLTVKTRLENLRNQLLTSSSHEIQSGRDRFSSV